MKTLDAWKLPLGGTTLIEASAGTGKTYTLTTLYLRLLVEHGLTPSQILVVTYTKAATAELKERVRARIVDAIESGESKEADRDPAADPEAAALAALGRRAREVAERTGQIDPLRRALQGFDEAAIFTIHGFCQRVLQENAFESGLAFDMELIENAEPIERTLAHDLWARLLADEDPGFVEWLLEGPGRTRWQWAPDKLQANLLSKLGADERMPILPKATPAESSASVDPGPLAKALRTWAEAWPRAAARVAGILSGDTDLNGNSYRAKVIAERWLPEFDRLAASIGTATDRELGAVVLPDFFERLTQEGLRAKTNKGGETPVDPVFDVFSSVFDAYRQLSDARDLQALALRRRFVTSAREESRRRRDEVHHLVFDDLLAELDRALEGATGSALVDLLRKRYPFALIDEFQDTTPFSTESSGASGMACRRTSAKGGLRPKGSS